MVNINVLKEIRGWLRSSDQDAFLAYGLPIEKALCQIEAVIAELEPRTIQGCATSALNALSKAVGLPIRSTDELGKTLALVISKSAALMNETHGDRFDEKARLSSSQCDITLSSISASFKEISDIYDITPFNLVAAKENAPVKTRDGRKARIICFDANNVCKDLDDAIAPLIVLVAQDNTEDLILTYTEDGRCTEKNYRANLELVMA